MKNKGIWTFSLLGLAFILLKLTGVITWSWWLVTSPLWIGATIFVLFFALAIMLFLDDQKEMEKLYSEQINKL